MNKISPKSKYGKNIVLYIDEIAWLSRYLLTILLEIDVV